MVAMVVGLLFAQKVMAESLDRSPVQMFPSSASKGVVTFFVLSGCPNAQAYVPEMNRIAKAYGPKGWKFYVDFADSMFSWPSLRKSYKDYGYTFPGLAGRGDLAARGHVTMSPEVAVFSPAGQLLYHGRIDDRFYALGKQRLEARVHDLRLTLDAVDAGKPVPRSHSDVIGCYLPID